MSEKISIEITQEQWGHIQELMLFHNITQEEAITYLLVVGMREVDFREVNA